MVMAALSSQPAEPLSKPTWAPAAPELGSRIRGKPAAWVGVLVDVGLDVAVSEAVGVSVGVADGVRVGVGVEVELAAVVTVKSAEPELPSMSVATSAYWPGATVGTVKVQPELLVTSVPRPSLRHVPTLDPPSVRLTETLSSQPAEPLSKLTVAPTGAEVGLSTTL